MYNIIYLSRTIVRSSWATCSVGNTKAEYRKGWTVSICPAQHTHTHTHTGFNHFPTTVALESREEQTLWGGRCWTACLSAQAVNARLSGKIQRVLTTFSQFLRVSCVRKGTGQSYCLDNEPSLCLSSTSATKMSIVLTGCTFGRSACPRLDENDQSFLHVGPLWTPNFPHLWRKIQNPDRLIVLGIFAHCFNL